MAWVKIEDFVDQVKHMDNKIIRVSIDTRDIACWISEEEDILDVHFPYHINEILEILYKTRNYEWCWVRNTEFKYVKLLMDTKTKMCSLMDREGNVRTIEDLKRQR